jgi:hypothetical protein
LRLSIPFLIPVLDIRGFILMNRTQQNAGNAPGPPKVGLSHEARPLSSFTPGLPRFIAFLSNFNIYYYFILVRFNCDRQCLAVDLSFAFKVSLRISRSSIASSA